MPEKTSTFSVAATSRTQTGKQVKKLRQAGQLPAVVYGHNKESRSIVMSARDFMTTFKEAGSSSLIDLKIDGGKVEKVLVHDVQVFAPTNTATHVDFYLVNMLEKLQTEITLEFVGTSNAVDADGGTLITSKDVVNVECLPQDLVPSIEVDISAIVTFEADIRVKNIVAPAGIEILDDPEEMIAAVVAPRSEEELAELDEVPEATLEVESLTGNEPAAAEGETKEEEK